MSRAMMLALLSLISFCSGQQNAVEQSADYRYKAVTVANPSNGWHLLCSEVGSCEMAFITISMERGLSPAITDIAGLTLSGRAAARDATIVFQNDQGSTVRLHSIACSGFASCFNTQIITGFDVALLSLSCAPGACIGCEVKFDAASPGIPCAPNGSPGAEPVAPPLTDPPTPPIVVVPATPSPTVPAAAPLTPSPTEPVVAAVTPSPVLFVRTPSPTEPLVAAVPTNHGIPPLPSPPPTVPIAPTPPPVVPTTASPTSLAPTSPTMSPTMRPTTSPPTTAMPTQPVSPLTVEPLYGVGSFVCDGFGLCAGGRQQIVNPVDGFYLFCTEYSCTNMLLTIDLQQTAGAPIRSLHGFLFQGDSAAAGATVTVNNEQSGTVTSLGTITCSGHNACAGTQIIMGYQTTITAVHCEPGACTDCVVRTAPGAQPWPCDPQQPLTPDAPINSMPSEPPRVPAPVPSVDVGLPPGTELLTSPRHLECFNQECAERRYRVNNPLNAFYLYCGDFGSCRGGSFNLWYSGTGYTRIDRIECKGEESCSGATVRVNNQQRRDVVEVNKILCDAKNACSGTTFDVGYEVAIGAVECSAESCSGCTVIVGGTSYPCDPQQAL